MLVFREEARVDLQQAFAWYQRQQSGLGKSFIHEIDRVFERIEAQPAQFAFVHGRVRRALCKRFPYAVYFVDNSPELIVLAVLHQKRHTASWRHRSG